MCQQYPWFFAEQQGVLTDVLEVPSLMDICLRSSSYDDALDLRAFISKVAVLQPDLPVSNNARCSAMQEGLLNGLNLQLLYKSSLILCDFLMIRLRHVSLKLCFT